MAKRKAKDGGWQEECNMKLWFDRPLIAILLLVGGVEMNPILSVFKKKPRSLNLQGRQKEETWKLGNSWRRLRTF